ncbi:MAG: hypothetical protein WBV22_04780 [Anaerolineaceae bacterium]
MITNPTTPQLTILDTLSGLQITWQGKKDWGRFFNSVFSLLYNLLFILLAVILYREGLFYMLSPFSLAGIVIIAVVVYSACRLIEVSLHLMDALLDREIIQIDARSLTIERSGFLNFERHVSIPAERIKNIKLGALGFPKSILVNLTKDGNFLSRFKLSGDVTFCRGISEADVTSVLGKIHERFPRYKDIKP